MIFFLLLSKQRLYPLLGACVVFLVIFIPVQSNLKGPPEKCKVSVTNVSTDIDGQHAEVEFPLEKPIEIQPGETIFVTAEIKPLPEQCSGNLSIEWRLPSGFDEPRVNISSEISRDNLFKVTLSTQIPENSTEQRTIRSIISVSVGSTKQIDQKILSFKIQGG
jgi:hypothetical protein